MAGTSPAMTAEKRFAAEERHVQLIWPWQDRTRKFSVLKAGTFALMFVPAIWLVDQVAGGELGPGPLRSPPYCCGILVNRNLLVTPADNAAVTLFGLRGHP